MKLQVKKGTGRWEFFVALTSDENGRTDVQTTATQRQAHNFLKQEDAESMVGFLEQERPDFETRIQ